MRPGNTTYGCLIAGGVLGGSEGLSGEMRSGEGTWLAWTGGGFVSGARQHSSAEMGRPRGLMAGKVALSRCTPDSFVIVGK